MFFDEHASASNATDTRYSVDDDGGYAEVVDGAVAEVRTPSQEAPLDATAAELFWKVYIKALLCDKFGRLSLTRDERAPDFNLRFAVSVSQLTLVFCYVHF